MLQHFIWMTIPVRPHDAGICAGTQRRPALDSVLTTDEHGRENARAQLLTASVIRRSSFARTFSDCPNTTGSPARKSRLQTGGWRILTTRSKTGFPFDTPTGLIFSCEHCSGFA
jgi:hypothetical protein